MAGFVEHGAVLTGHQRGGIWLLRCQRPVRGAPHSVETDWRWTLEREESHGDVLGFFHTHPPGAGPAPSQRDVLTMRGWCSAFGKPLLCSIGCGRILLTTRFVDDQDPGTAWGVSQRFPRGVIVVVEGDRHDLVRP